MEARLDIPAFARSTSFGFASQKTPFRFSASHRLATQMKADPEHRQQSAQQDRDSQNRQHRTKAKKPPRQARMPSTSMALVGIGLAPFWLTPTPGAAARLTLLAAETFSHRRNRLILSKIRIAAKKLGRPLISSPPQRLMMVRRARTCRVILAANNSS